MVLEVACGLPVLLRQRHPQLDAMDDVGVGDGDLRVGDAVAAGHEVRLAGPGWAREPREPRCSIPPLNSQLTV